MQAKKQKRTIDMLSGSLWDKILLFALPLAASSILQQLFNSADIAVVGQFAGSRALAAVGSNGPVINLLVNIFVGLSIGANVVIARYLGENNAQRAGRAAHTAVTVAFLSGIIIMGLGQLITRPILTLMSTPDDIIDLAILYLRIYFLGMPFIMLYNFEAAILRSRGDTKRPFFALLVSGVINIILNLFFVIVCKLSVAGVAIATVIANVVSSGMLLFFLMHEEGALKIKLKNLRIDFRILREIAQIGLPAGLQGVVFSVSNICVQSSLNQLGSDAVAGCAAALNFEFFVYYMLNSFSQACVTFTSQNYGAGQYERCRAVTRWCLLLGSVFTMAMSLAFYFSGHTLIKIYTSEQIVADLGCIRMRYALLPQLFNAIMDVLSGSMRGLGRSLVPALISIVGVCGVRLIWVYLVFPQSPTFETLLMVYPVSWIITSAAIAAAYFKTRKSIGKAAV